MGTAGLSDAVCAVQECIYGAGHSVTMKSHRCSFQTAFENHPRSGSGFKSREGRPADSVCPSVTAALSPKVQTVCHRCLSDDSAAATTLSAQMLCSAAK